MKEQSGCSLVVQVVENLSAMQETQVRSLGQEYPLEEGMATHSSILAWRISWTEEPGRLQSIGSQTVRHGSATTTFTFTLLEQWMGSRESQARYGSLVCFYSQAIGMGLPVIC